MSTYLFSVVIPNYNNTDLLKRCLASIPYDDDIQIVIVDDNSDSNKIDFNHYPGLVRKNCELILLKENRGGGYARNIGMKNAKGKWLLFADSDDFYVKNAFSVLREYANSIEDVIYYNIDSVNSRTLERGHRNRHYDDYIKSFINGDDIKGENIRFKKWEPWNKMINRSFVENNRIYFDELPRCNDMMFSLKVSYAAKKYKIIKDKIYCVTYNTESITRRKFTKEVYWSCFLCEYKKNAFYRFIGHPEWRSKFFYITLMLLKNNGIFDAFVFSKLILEKRELLKKEADDLLVYLENLE